METKHTKGEWKAVKNNSYWDVFTNIKKNHLAISVNLFKDDENDDIEVIDNSLTEENEANAKLIAGSPVMIDYIIKKAEEGDTEAKSIATSILK